MSIYDVRQGLESAASGIEEASNYLDELEEANDSWETIINETEYSDGDEVVNACRGWDAVVNTLSEHGFKGIRDDEDAVLAIETLIKGNGSSEAKEVLDALISALRRSVSLAGTKPDLGLGKNKEEEALLPGGAEA